MEIAAMDRRVTKLEGDIVDLGKCVIRLETTQGHMIKANEKFEEKQDEILDKVNDLHNGSPATSVTFKWILEKIALPLLLGGGSAALALFAMAKVLGWT